MNEIADLVKEALTRYADRLPEAAVVVTATAVGLITAFELAPYAFNKYVRHLPESKNLNLSDEAKLFIEAASYVKKKLI